jgi:ankyrin repeat protein
MAYLQEKYDNFYKNIRNVELATLVELIDYPEFDINFQNQQQFRNTPLMCATIWDRDDVATVLLDRGASPKNPSIGIASYIDVALQCGSIKIIELFLNRGIFVDVNKKYFTDKTPLYIASQKGYKDLVNLLLSKGANIDLYTVNIAKNNNNDIVHILETWTMAQVIPLLDDLWVSNQLDFGSLVDLLQYTGNPENYME